MISTRLFKIARIASGTVFILAGTLKMFAPFGDFLAQVNVPLPQLAGRAVPLLEIGGGAVLILAPKIPNILVKLAALALAVDMVAALVLVGAPGMRGRSHTIQNHAIGAEPWRVPLEVFLLLTTLWIAMRSTDESSTR